ncbi:TetR/AcrR family transcriptional regulator [Bradyrhizobium sp. 14AA]
MSIRTSRRPSDAAMSHPAKPSTRDRILETALDRFLTHGHDQVSMRQIASDVGVTPMAIYRHFENKEQLQLALLEAGYGIFAAYLERHREGRSAADRLMLLADGFIDFALDKSPYFELIFLSGRNMSGLRDRDSARRISRPTYRMLHGCVKDCIESGYLRQDDVHLVSTSILAFCIGNAALFISGSMNWSKKTAKLEIKRAFSDYVDLLASSDSIHQKLTRNQKLESSDD